ncbi:MAG: hypothetical protein ACTSR2_02860 [Candidatus Hodarchaeales archaeon]
MGYPPRKTAGWLDCRPKEFKSDKFPRPAVICSPTCPYFIFCKLELNHMTLGERLREIKLITQKPYHFFTRGETGRGVILVLEGTDGSQLTFRGNNMNEAVETAEQYVEHERKMGRFRVEEKKRKK